MRVREPDGLDYATLLDDGIKIVQAMASDQWTDYNLHDPGVTILQQLCYALTDLVYRAGYDDEDLFQPHAAEARDTTLFPGPQILTGAPVTLHDFRDLLYAQIENLENVWVRPSDDPRGIAGLHDIDVQPYKVGAQQKDQILRNAVLTTYVAARPLCEDIDRINILEHVDVIISGDIEIDETDTVNDIAANILFALQQQMVPAPSYSSIHIERSLGRTYDELFEGPQLAILIKNDTPDRRPLRIPIERLIKIARGASGVRTVRQLSAAGDDDADPTSPGVEWSASHFPRIDAKSAVPASSKDPLNFILRRGQIPLPLDGERIESNIEHRQYMDYEGVLSTMRSVKADPYNSSPIGVPRDLARYTTIREQFPDVYGLGRAGLSQRIVAPGYLQQRQQREARLAQVAQLKAYLLIFEQLMANHLAQLDNLPALFSVQAGAADRTYFSQSIATADTESPLQINDVLPEDAATRIPDLVQQWDNRHDRRERLLNHLLARFNEAFDDQRWTRVWESGDGIGSSSDAMVDQRNRAKTTFLRDLPFVSGFRGSGIDYSQPSDQGGVGQAEAADNATTAASGRTCAAAGLERRLILLTGLQPLYVVEHILLRNRFDLTDGALADFYAQRLSVIAPSSVTGPSDQMADFLFSTLDDNCPAHIDSRCFFLDGDAMATFIALYTAWRDGFARIFAGGVLPTPADRQELDWISQPLRAFLMMKWSESALDPH